MFIREEGEKIWGWGGGKGEGLGFDGLTESEGSLMPDYVGLGFM